MFESSDTEYLPEPLKFMYFCCVVMRFLEGIVFQNVPVTSILKLFLQ